MKHFLLILALYFALDLANGDFRYALPEESSESYESPEIVRPETTLHELPIPLTYGLRPRSANYPAYLFNPDDKGKCKCGVNDVVHIRVLGGVDAELHEFPWQIGLFSWKKGVFCGGTLLNSRYILTAAHCVVNNTKEIIKVVLGDHDLSSNLETKSKSIKVEKIIIHPDYISNVFNKDIAIIRMAKEVTFDNKMSPACLAGPNYDYDAKKTMITGWGATGEGKPSHPVLQKAILKLVNDEECKKGHGPMIESTVICAGGTKGVDACQGDSGGPLVQTDGYVHWLIGVVAWGSGCGSELPGVYTKVDQFTDWIYDNIKDGQFCQ